MLVWHRRPRRWSADGRNGCSVTRPVDRRRPRLRLL